MNNILDLDQGQYANRSQWPYLRRPDRTTSLSTMGSTAVEWKRRIDVMSLTENPHDLDQIQEIERTIAQLLKHGEPAEVDKGIIENGYSLLNATQGEVAGTVHEKCAAIVGVLKDKYSIDAEYSILDGMVRFVPVRPMSRAPTTSPENLA